MSKWEKMSHDANSEKSKKFLADMMKAHTQPNAVSAATETPSALQQYPNHNSGTWKKAKHTAACVRTKQWTNVVVARALTTVVQAAKNQTGPLTNWSARLSQPSILRHAPVIFISWVFSSPLQTRNHSSSGLNIFPPSLDIGRLPRFTERNFDRQIQHSPPKRSLRKQPDRQRRKHHQRNHPKQNPNPQIHLPNRQHPLHQRKIRKPHHLRHHADVQHLRPYLPPPYLQRSFVGLS